MDPIAAMNETNLHLQSGRILLRPREILSALRAAACCFRLAASLEVGKRLKCEVSPIVDGSQPNLEWIKRLPILFGEISYAIE